MGKHSEDKEIKNKKRRKKKGLGLRIFIFILILLAIGGGIFAKKVHDLGGGWSGVVAALMGHNKNTLENLEEIRVLILGESTGLTDTIIIASYNPKTQKSSMLSIPRDTFTGSNTSSANANYKINTLAGGGKTPEKTLKAVNELTGLDIKYYVYIDTTALIELVDTIGGIEFEVPINMNYDDEGQNLHINFKAGKQKLTGQKVEELVRFRHNNDGTTYSYEYGIEDYGRMHTQRDVIKAIVKQTINFKNISEIKKIIDIFKTYVKTNLDLDNMKDYVPYAMNFDLNTLQTEQLPGTSRMLNGVSFFLNDDDETKTVIEKLFIKQSEQESN